MEKSMPGPTTARAWGEFRLSVVGGLLASPPVKGELKPSLQQLASKQWRHPLTGEPTQFSFATIEQWFYVARKNFDDPVTALSTGRRRDRGHGRHLSEGFKAELARQYERFPDWTVKLHADNLRVLVENRPELAPAPSYMAVRRYLKQNGLTRKKKVRRKSTPGLELAQSRLDKRKIRSCEVDHVGALWHLDFHETASKVRKEAGEWISVHCLAIHNDHSRLACHVQ